MAIHITEQAARKVRDVIASDQPDAKGIRIGLSAGGCAGMSYQFGYATEIGERDKVFEEHGVKVVVDRKSYLFLIGTTLHWTDGLAGGWKVVNPNVKEACGCGESVSF